MLTFSQIGNMGRLGNQMFQMASTIGIARKLNLTPGFPLENFQSQSAYSKIGCDLLSCFNIPNEYLISSTQFGVKFVYYENSFTYDPITEKLPDFTDINGYFQTEKYFFDISHEIRNLFTFKKEINHYANNYYENINDCVSIHIRRGDYLESPDRHPCQSEHYYLKAISEFGYDKIYYIFSDDIAWCKTKFLGDNFKFVDGNNPFIDMCLMTKLKNHIIANSSFSWWGAWLSGEKSNVISPKNWFGPAMNKDTSDIHCKNWIVI